MKKNKMLRIASAMLVLTLLTTSVIGGTFAKYVTTDRAQDAARVAKFGVVATVSGDLFGSTYKAVADGNTITAYDVSANTVSSSDAAKVVAPGTKNTEGLSLTVTGTPEVTTQLTATYADSDIYLNAGHYGVMVEYKGVKTADNIGNYYVKDAAGKFTTATADNLTGTVYELRDDVNFTGDAYHPLTWYVDNAAVANQDAVKTAITDAFKGDATVAPNTDLAKAKTIGWEWAFGSAAGAIEDQDRKDTILGDMIAQQKGADVTVVAAVDGGYATVTFETTTTEGIDNVIIAKAGDAKVACLTAAVDVSITVEQVD